MLKLLMKYLRGEIFRSTTAIPIQNPLIFSFFIVYYLLRDRFFFGPKYLSKVVIFGRTESNNERAGHTQTQIFL